MQDAAVGGAGCEATGGSATGKSTVGDRRDPGLRAALWASLVPLSLLLHPYAGVVQDARIYVGRGVADRDPAGVGRDVMFANDGQTSFTLMRGLVDAALGVMGPGVAGMTLAAVGAAVWLVAAAAAARALAGNRGRDAWACAACMVALPTFYGAFRVFDYAEAVATPRVFAEAAVLAGLAVLAGPCAAGSRRVGRLGIAAALFALGIAFHPLIALPGAAVAAALLVRGDRRRLVAGAAAAAAIAVAVVLAAASGSPVSARLTALSQPMDAVWLSLLRQRSTYLFPSLWPASAFGPILCQATAVIVASAVSAPAVRALLTSVLGVAMLGLAASWLWGDVHPLTIVVQLQPWRALWLLAAFGNAALALAVTGLWRRRCRNGSDARLVLAPLVLAWLLSDQPWLVVALAAMTLVGLAAALRDALPPASGPVRWACAAAVLATAVLAAWDSASVGLALARSARAAGVPVGWPLLAGLGIPTVPAVAAALALAATPPAALRAWNRSAVIAAAIAAVVCGCALAAWQWDARSPERRLAEGGGADPALQAAIGPAPGEVMWVDEESESWFLAGRPSFFNSVQGAPILFSRALAMEWADRAAFALRLGLARPSAVAPWADLSPRFDPLVPGPDAVALFCAGPRRPAAVVMPGEQTAAVPAGWTASLWRPGMPSRRPWLDGDAIRWTRRDAFTVVRCPPPPRPAATAPAQAQPDPPGARSGDAGSLG